MSTILILEDEAAISTLLRLMLEAKGFQVLEADSAKEAIRCFEDAEGGLDLLIADVNLARGATGVKAALELRSLASSLPIILISGALPDNCDDLIAAEWSKIPSDLIVTLRKPFRPAELLQAVHRLLGIPALA